MKFLKCICLLFLLLNCKDYTENNTERKSEIVTKKNVNFEIENTSENDSIFQIEKNFLLGKFDYKTHPDFIKVDAKLSSKTLYLQKETYEAFVKMYNAAQKDGINLIIVSGTRSFIEQRRIWNRKWRRYEYLSPVKRIKKIMEYSAMPSTSRHHWGTDLDLNNLTNSYFDSGKGKKIYDWLIENANDFGFYQVYTNKSSGRTGYNLERWHWSYLPSASNYLNAYNLQVTYKDISGFEGSEFAERIKVISEYVNGISEKSSNYN